MRSLTVEQTRELNGGWFIKWWSAKCKLCGYSTGWTSEGTARNWIHTHIQGKHHKFWTTPYRKFSTKLTWR